MSIDSIFLLSQGGELIGIKTYKGQNQKENLGEFYQQFIKRYRGQHQDREYPIMKIKNAFYGFVTTSDILVGAIFTQEIPVLQLYSTLFLVIDVLKGSFKDKLSSEMLKTSFTQIAMMLDALLDNGYPLITQKFVLESMIKPSGVLEKIEQVIVGRSHSGKENTQTLESYIDTQNDIREHSQYRISEIKGEETLLFDVIEYLDCVIDKNGRSIVEEINGEIKMDCNLSGTPELFIFLNQPTTFNDYSVHECLLNRCDVYEREKILNFIPPTGNSTMFYYNIKNAQIRVPFDFIPRVQKSEKSVHIELKLANKPVRGQSYVVEEFHIKLVTPANLNLDSSDISLGQISQLENAVLWRIGRLEIDHSSKLSLTFSSKGQNNQLSGNFIACLKFLVNTYSPSLTKIEKVEVRNGAKVLTKKARNIAKSGYYEVRLT